MATLAHTMTPEDTPRSVQVFWYAPTGERILNPPGRIGPVNENDYPIIAEMRAQGRFGEAKALLKRLRSVPEFSSIDAYLNHHFARG